MNFNELFPLQVFINLDKRTDRLKICREEEFPKIGINPIRKAGVMVDQIEHPWWRGAVGCLLSHYHILQSAILLGTNVFIFEDDIHFKGTNTLEVLDLCCEELNQREWDMFYIAVNVMKPFYKVSESLAKLNSGQSTVAYGVNKNFIEKLLSYIQLDKIEAPIDVIYSERVIPNHNVYVSYPMLAIQRDSFSDIENADVKYSEYLEKRYWENLRKINE